MFYNNQRLHAWTVSPALFEQLRKRLNPLHFSRVISPWRNGEINEIAIEKIIKRQPYWPYVKGYVTQSNPSDADAKPIIPAIGDPDMAISTVFAHG